MKTFKIETSDWHKVKAGDRISVLRDNCNYLGLLVEETRDGLYIAEKSFGRPHSSKKNFLNSVPDDWVLRSIVRAESQETKEGDSHWGIFNFLKRSAPAPKVGSQEAIRAAIASTDSIVNYWDTRIQLGDPLFDQWMVDAHESAKAASKNLKKLLKIMEGDE
jgi:hypothetical protein